MDRRVSPRTTSTIDIGKRETESERENTSCTGTFREYSTHCHSKLTPSPPTSAIRNKPLRRMCNVNKFVTNVLSLSIHE